MSKVEEITTALQDFSTEELQTIERALISIYRQRRTGIIFDDTYGTWTEEDQAAAAAQAFTLMGEFEKKHPQSPKQ